jgi:hypothetical protein
VSLLKSERFVTGITSFENSISSRPRFESFFKVIFAVSRSSSVLFELELVAAAFLGLKTKLGSP